MLNISNIFNVFNILNILNISNILGNIWPIAKLRFGSAKKYLCLFSPFFQNQILISDFDRQLNYY